MRDHLLQTDKSGDNVAPYLMREPGRHCDGGGLYLEVAAPGQASWMYRHKNRWASLGSANGYSIREAREKAAKLWQAARRGEDPFALLATLRAPKIGEKPKGKTFAEAMTQYLDAKSPHWSPSNRARERRHHEFLFAQVPDFVALRLSAIDQDAKNTALAHWNGKEKARRDVCFYIEAIIKYAETGKLRIVGGKKRKQQHHEAMPWQEVPDFYRLLADTDSMEARALRFLILTSARTDEVIGRRQKGVWLKARPTWSEIREIEGKPAWVIPAWQEDAESYRGMKGGKDHVIPLSAAALALLGQRQGDDVPLFTVKNQNALLDTLRSYHDDYTVHGFRSSFSDWGIENRYSRDLVDMCIAHGEERDSWVDETTRKSYQRSELIELRREVMQGWSDHILKAQHDAPLVPDAPTRKSKAAATG